MTNNLVVQAIGPGCAFLTVFVVARLGGPAEQGRYAQLKAWTDFLVAVGCFGFPQGFVFTINKLRASAGALARWSRLYSTGFVPVALVGSFIALRLGAVGGGSSMPHHLAPPLAVAAGLLVLHGLWRGVYLTHNSAVPFALFTVLPAVTLFVLCTVCIVCEQRNFEYIILGSAVVTVVIGSRAMAPILRSPDQGTYRDQPWRSIMSNGVHSFVQAMLLTAQPMLAYALVTTHGGESRDAGFLNVGLFLVQGLSVPMTMVAPLLFARWTTTADDRLITRLHASTFRWLALGAVSGIMLAFGAKVAVPILFGREYTAAVAPTSAMLLTLPLVCHVRVLAPALHARGYPGINTVAGMTRLVSFGAGAFLLARTTGTVLLGAGLAWAAAEIFAGMVTFAGVKYALAEEPARAAQECE